MECMLKIFHLINQTELGFKKFPLYFPGLFHNGFSTKFISTLIGLDATPACKNVHYDSLRISSNAGLLVPVIQHSNACRDNIVPR